MKLTPLELQLPRLPGPLLPQIRRALAPHGQVLRWAITAVDTRAEQPLLTVEAMLLEASGSVEP